MHSARRRIRELTAISLAGVLLLGVLEGACRLAGRPFGDFAVFFRDGQLHPPNQTLEMNWGAIPYVVETNHLGFRGPDFAREKPPGTLRILTLGDSATDGFFVDNAATWQAILEAQLVERLERPVEVINGARGGGSIDKQFAMLKASAPLVQPDLVLLTFITNDVSEIWDKPLEALLAQDVERRQVPWREQLQRFLITRLALGELLFDARLRWRSRSYRQRVEREAIRFDDARYAIEGGDDFAANAAAFLALFGHTDGRVLGESFDEETERAFASYGAVLERVVSACRAMDAELVLVYFPAYPQIYDPQAPREINRRLRGLAEGLGAGFLDATDGFREQGRGRVLHLAPVDYHMNPRGHAVFAQLLADHLVALPGAQRR